MTYILKLPNSEAFEIPVEFYQLLAMKGYASLEQQTVFQSESSEVEVGVIISIKKEE